MKLQQALNEYNNDIPLLDWNMAQRNLWYSLTGEKEVSPDKIPLFMKFAKFFDSWYSRYHKFPSTQQTKRLLHI